MKTIRISKLLELATLLTAGASYWLSIHRIASREINHWKDRAEAIPNPILRAQATHKLTGERLNPEAAAFFAILAPRRTRKRLIRLIVAFQIAYDYLDAINEAPNTASLQNGLWLHRALNDAVSLEPSQGDYYRYHPQKDDGSYLNSLIAVCRVELAGLPSRSTLSSILLQATERCGEAQCRNHAVSVEGKQQLKTWSKASSDRAGYLWWELAAAGISSLGIHALFAAAASNATVAEAHLLDAAYFPPVCAISALLDSLVDHADDTETTNHSFVGHYATNSQAALRFGEITGEACEMLRPLAHNRRHTVLLAGIASFYLSAHESQSPFAEPVTAKTLLQLGAISRPILVVMRLMRHHAGVSSTQELRLHTDQPQPAKTA